MDEKDEKLLEQLDSLQRVTTGILAALIIHKERGNQIIGRTEPVFQDTANVLASQINVLSGFIPDLSQGGYGQTYDLLLRYQSIVVSLRTLEKGYLVLLINQRAELPTIRSFSTLTVRNLNQLMRGN